MLLNYQLKVKPSLSSCLSEFTLTQSEVRTVLG